MVKFGLIFGVNLWDGDKIIEEVQFFNPTAFNSEGLAKEMSLDK